MIFLGDGRGPLGTFEGAILGAVIFFASKSPAFGKPAYGTRRLAPRRRWCSRCSWPAWPMGGFLESRFGWRLLPVGYRCGCRAIPLAEGSVRSVRPCRWPGLTAEGARVPTRPPEGQGPMLFGKTILITGAVPPDRRPHGRGACVAIGRHESSAIDCAALAPPMSFLEATSRERRRERARPPACPQSIEALSASSGVSGTLGRRQDGWRSILWCGRWRRRWRQRCAKADAVVNVADRRLAGAQPGADKGLSGVKGFRTVEAVVAEFACRTSSVHHLEGGAAALDLPGAGTSPCFKKRGSASTERSEKVSFYSCRSQTPILKGVVPRRLGDERCDQRPFAGGTRPARRQYTPRAILFLWLRRRPLRNQRRQPARGPAPRGASGNAEVLGF